jgi:hypothetical protein
MRNCKIILITVLTLLSQVMSAQEINKFLDYYNFHKTSGDKKTIDYIDIQGSPYLNSEFIDGIIYLKDTTAVKLPLRYNIYSDEMEYQIEGVSFTVGNAKFINKILLGESIFVYLPFINSGGYFELIESGNCFLVQKRSVKFKPAEKPKPIEGNVTPAKFVDEPDIFYMIVNDTLTVEIKNMKSVINALQDQKSKVESFIKQEKIKRVKKENLIKIAEYYNSL